MMPSILFFSWLSQSSPKKKNIYDYLPCQSEAKEVKTGFPKKKTNLTWAILGQMKKVKNYFQIKRKIDHGRFLPLLPLRQEQQHPDGYGNNDDGDDVDDDDQHIDDEDQCTVTLLIVIRALIVR